MDRRSFMHNFLPNSAMRELPVRPLEKPKQNLISGLQPYSGKWSEVQANHLLRRSLFGVKPSELRLSTKLGLDATIEMLLAPALPKILPPIYTISRWNSFQLAPQWAYDNGNCCHSERIQALQAAWVRDMLMQGMHIQEKLSLCLSSILVTNASSVNDPRLMFQYLKLIRSNALGSYKELVRNMGRQGAMLKYLHVDKNTRFSPNEDFARELLELFTLGRVNGKGQENYNEQDVIEVARCMTGYKVQQINTLNLMTNQHWSLNAVQHDNGQKVFSSHFNNETIQARWSFQYTKEYDQVIDMIYQQTAAAEHICRKLYQFFVNPLITPDIELQIISPLAEVCIQNDFSIAAVLRTLLSSEHFFQPNHIGAIIKNPADYSIGMYRTMVPQEEFLRQTLVFQAQFCNNIAMELEHQQLHLLHAPSVSGFPAWHQKPDYTQLWINTSTLYRRKCFVHQAVNKGFLVWNAPDIPILINNNQKVSIGKFLLEISNFQPLSCTELVERICVHLFPEPISQSQQDFIVNHLFGGMSDSEFQEVYWRFCLEELSPIEIASTESRFKALFSHLFELAEYHCM